MAKQYQLETSKVVITDTVGTVPAFSVDGVEITPEETVTETTIKNKDTGEIDTLPLSYGSDQRDQDIYEYFGNRTKPVV